LHLATQDGRPTSPQLAQVGRRTAVKSNLFASQIGLDLATFINQISATASTRKSPGACEHKAVQELVRYFDAKFPCLLDVGVHRSAWNDVGVIMEQIFPLAANMTEVIETAHTVQMLVQTFTRARPSGGGEMIKSMIGNAIMGSTLLKFHFVDTVLNIEAVAGPLAWEVAFNLSNDGIKLADLDAVPACIRAERDI